jgi:hypothetical protein
MPFPVRVKPHFNTNLTTLNTIQDVFDISLPLAKTIVEEIHFQPDADLIAKTTKIHYLTFSKNVSLYK